ncbi:MAG: CDP-archaeol synthase [Pseudomonadales bacterium]|nr:CDP-archaeol synthase [Pseudomonadales bacterium]
MSEHINKEPGFFIIKLNPVDCLTLLGVFLSCFAIGLMLKGMMELAIAVLYLAVIADAFDGILARKLGLTREFGRYLDGFVDTLDYLVAPALFLHLWGFSETYQSVLLMLFICCGFIRLSVFNEVGNIEDEHAGLGYLGAPVFWSALILGPLYLLHMLIGLQAIFILLNLLLPVFSIMMVHNGRYYKFKNPLFILLTLLAMSLLFVMIGSNNLESELSWIEVLKSHIATGLLASVPVIFGGAIHMVVVRYDLLSFLKIPVLTAFFGQNKTWRGFVVMPVGSALGFLVLNFFIAADNANLTVDFARYSFITAGLIIGLAYVLAELPNSFIKRRLGVAPGEVPEKNARLFILADQLDSGILCLVAYWYFWHMPLLTCLITLLMAPLIALLVKRMLHVMGLKKSAT